MEPIRLERYLRLNNAEGFRVRRGFFGETLCYMLLADFRRPSTLADFPCLIGIEDENEFGRSNYIRVIILHDAPLEKDLQSEIISIAGCFFLENKDDCHWNATFEKIDSETFAAMAQSLSAMMECFERVLQHHGLDVRLTDISEDKFNYLSQD